MCRYQKGKEVVKVNEKGDWKGRAKREREGEVGKSQEERKRGI